MEALNHIVIIGLPGVGKTTIGKMLSTKLEKSHFDTDEQIELNENRPIPLIISEDGEPFFRKIEKDVFKNIINENQPSVISTGGGIVMDIDNRELIRNKSLCLYIECDLNEIAERLDVSKRPLLYNTNKIKALSGIFEDRFNYYENLANIKVDISKLDHFSSLAKIYDRIISVK
jgi:shikimate kinase